jgi:serine/threonine protein kinase
MSNSLQSGSQVREFDINGLLGAGGFGITYSAWDRRLESRVALKEYFPAALAMRVGGTTVIMRPGSQDGAYDWGMEKFLHEAHALASLQHSHIVGVNKLFQANGTAYMAINYVEGSTFKDWLRDLGRLPTQDELDRIVHPLLGALEAVHKLQLLHRDLSPKNIMIAPPLKPVLIDFGAARQLVGARSQTFAAVLTPGYAPSEQYGATGSSQGPWTDIYALSATLYEAITGEVPPEAPGRTLDDTMVPSVDRGRGRYRHEFLAALDWGLKPMPKERPQTVADWRQAFGSNDLLAPPSAPQHSAQKAAANGWFGWGRGKSH